MQKQGYSVNRHKMPQPSRNFVLKPTPATYFLYFDFYWKLFPASPESLHISKSMVKGEEVRVGGSWVLSDQGQLQPPSLIPGATIPAIWLLFRRAPRTSAVRSPLLR